MRRDAADDRRAHRSRDGDGRVRRRGTRSHGGHLAVRRTHLPPAERADQSTRARIAPARRASRAARSRSCAATAPSSSRCTRPRCAAASGSRRSTGTSRPTRSRTSSTTAKRSSSSATRSFADTLSAAAKLLTGSPALLAVGGEIDGFASYDDALAAEAADDIDDPEPGGTMLYTSGTTGRPKGVRRAMGLAPGLYRLHSRNSPHAGDTNRSLVTGPLYHAAPLSISLTAPLAAGLGLVLMDGWSPEGDAASSSNSTASRTRTSCRSCSTVCCRSTTT